MPGADWTVTLADGILYAFAKYLLETRDGEWIAMENEGRIVPIRRQRSRSCQNSWHSKCKGSCPDCHLQIAVVTSHGFYDRVGAYNAVDL